MIKTTEYVNSIKEKCISNGFIKLPGKPGFIRISGDGLLTGICAGWNPRGHHFYDIWADIIWQDPENMFQCWREFPNSKMSPFYSTFPFYVIYPYLICRENSQMNRDDYLRLVREGLYMKMEEQTTFVVENIIPFLGQLDTIETFYNSLLDMEKIGGSFLIAPHKLINIEMYRNNYEGVRKQVDTIVKQDLEYLERVKKEDEQIIKDNLNIPLEYEREKERFAEEIDHFSGYLPMLEDHEKVHQYLEDCKNQNLEDIEIVMGKKIRNHFEEHLQKALNG